MASEVYREPVDPTATNNPHSYALQMTGSGKRVLEAGCSVGHVTEHLVAAGNTVVGVEIDPAAAEAAREFADRVHVVDLDIARLSEIEHDEFDVMIFGDVLEHLRDPVVALDDALALLAEGGRVVISVPNVAYVDVRLMLLDGRWDYQPDGVMDATHLRWFTRRSLRDLLTACGLVAVELRRVEIGRYGTALPIDHDAPVDDALAYIEADPDAHTIQFVVAAERDGVEAPGMVDDAPSARPPLDHSRRNSEAVQEAEDLRRRVADLEAERDAIGSELAAWETSLTARALRPFRSVWGRMRRSTGR